MLRKLSKFIIMLMNILMIYGCSNEHSIEENIQIMSFNVKFDSDSDPFSWEERQSGVFEIINTYKPDLIGFQEVTQPMYEDLQEYLNENYYSYGVLRSVDSNAEMAPIFVKKDKFNIENKDSFWLSETPEEDFSIGWDARHPRVTSYVTVADLKSNEPLFAFMNTHFDHRGIKARINSAELINKYIDKFDEEGLPVILAGDFNASPFELPIKTITERDNISDSFTSLPDDNQVNASTSHNFKGEIKGYPIDYIMVTQPYTIESSQIIHESFNEIYPSDHFPIIVEINKE